MAICSNVSRSSLLSDFRSLPGNVVNSLRTLIIGNDYAVYKYDASDDTNLIGQYDEDAGVSGAWPTLTSTQTVDQDTAEVFIVSAIVNYYADTATPPGATEGSRSGGSVNKIVHDGGSTIFAGDSRSGFLNADVEIGDYIQLDDTSTTPVETRVAGFEYSAGEPTILVLADSIPAAVGSNFNIILGEEVDEIKLPEADTTLTATTAQADSGITWATSRTGSAYPVIGASEYSGTNLSKVFVSYRNLDTANADSVLEINSQSDLDTYFTGWSYPESELGFALARALAPQRTPAITLPTVLGVVVADMLSSTWSDVFSRVTRRTDWYTCAPLTTDSTIQSMCETMIDNRAALDLPSRAMFSLALTDETSLYDTTQTVVVDDSQTPGEDRTITAASDSPFALAVTGDVVTIDGTDYVIDTIVTAQVCTTVTTIAGGAYSMTEVVHPLTVSEQSVDFGDRAAAFANRGISVVFPPSPTWNGETVDGYLMAAAIAGVRGYAAPHQSLGSVELEAGWSVPQSAYEFAGELAALADYGCLVVEDSIASPGTAVIAFTNTTDQSDTVDAYEGVVANADAVERYFRSLTDCYRGRTRITANTLRDLTQRASSGIEFLKTNTVISPIGAIIESGTVDGVIQDPDDLVKVTLLVNAVLAATMEKLGIDVSIELEVVG